MNACSGTSRLHPRQVWFWWALALLLRCACGSAAPPLFPELPDSLTPDLVAAIAPASPLALQAPALSVVGHLDLALRRGAEPPPPPSDLVSEERLVYAASDSTLRPAPRLPDLVFPYDLGRQGRADPEFAPFYLPEVYPGRTFQEMAGDDYLYSPSLYQNRGEWRNPFLIKQEEVERLAHDPPHRWARLAQAAALWWLYRKEGVRPDSVLDILTARTAFDNNEIVAGTAIPLALRFLPPVLTGGRPEEGQIAMDMAVHTSASFDSVAPIEVMLLSAAGRGLSGVVVADRGRIDGAQLAAALAEQLKRAGRLPAPFLVVTGETIETTSGGVLGLFLRERIPERMTMRATVAEIHRQGGLAYLQNPGLGPGGRLVRDLGFDGYMIRPGLMQTLRTLPLLVDPGLSHKTPLYASDSLYAAAAGLPYTCVDSPSLRPDDLVASLRENRAYSMGGIYLPYTIALAYKPLGSFLRFLNHFFEAHDWVETSLTRLVRADNVALVTTWDKEVQRWMGLWDLPSGVRRLARGDSVLNHAPEISQAKVDFGEFNAGYDLDSRQVWLATLLSW